MNMANHVVNMVLKKLREIVLLVLIDIASLGRSPLIDNNVLNAHDCFSGVAFFILICSLGWDVQ